MKNTRLTLAAALISGIIPIGCHKDDGETHFAQVELNNQLVSEIDKLNDDSFRCYIENTEHIGLSITAIDGKNTYFYNYGETHKGNNTLPSAKSWYEIGSNTKTFTAAVVPRWMVENDISAGTSLNDLLPIEFPFIPYQGNIIALKHLFNHTSGLPHCPIDMEFYDGFQGTSPYGNYDNVKLVHFFKNGELKKLPGSEYNSSNLGYLLLSRIVEYLYGIAIESQIASFITNPLGMGKPHMNLSQIIGSIPHVMGAYDENRHAGKCWTWSNWEGVGTLYSKLVALAKYARTHYKSFNSNAELTEVTSFTVAENFSNATFGVGRAWHIAKKMERI